MSQENKTNREVIEQEKENYSDRGCCEYPFGNEVAEDAEGALQQMLNDFPKTFLDAPVCGEVKSLLGRADSLCDAETYHYEAMSFAEDAVLHDEEIQQIINASVGGTITRKKATKKKKILKKASKKKATRKKSSNK